MRSPVVMQFLFVVVRCVCKQMGVLFNHAVELGFGWGGALPFRSWRHVCGACVYGGGCMRMICMYVPVRCMSVCILRVCVWCECRHLCMDVRVYWIAFVYVSVDVAFCLVHELSTSCYHCLITITEQELRASSFKSLWCSLVRACAAGLTPF